MTTTKDKEKKTRRSRFSTEPFIGKDGKPVVVYSRDLTDLDIAMFSVLVTDRVQSAAYIAARVGSTEKWVRDRFNILKREPNLYVRVTPEQVNNPKNHLTSKLYFELCPAGIAALKERGTEVPRRYPVRRLKHQVMTDEIMASWRIGFEKHKELTPLWWPQILASEKTPKATRGEKAPHRVPVTYYFRDKRITDAEYVPDAQPFGILRPDRRGYFFLGIEADCDSESLRSDNNAAATIERKVSQQIAIIEQEIYRTRYGFPNVFFPYYAPTEERLTSIMDVISELTEHKPSLRKSFVFAVHPTFTSFSYEKNEPTGWALTRDYRRIGYDPINFSK